MQWVIADPPPGHRLLLGHLLELLAAPVADVACERLLRFLAFVAPFDAARPVEYVLQGNALHIRKTVEMRGCGPYSFGGEGSPRCVDSQDPAHAIASALATNGERDSRVFALYCRAGELPAVTHRLEGDSPAACERFSLLYAFAPDTAWALHLYQRPEAEFRAEEIEAICAVAPLLRQVHRAGSPPPVRAEERVDVAEVRLGLRAPELSKRERQVCARITVGYSAAMISTELCIALSTVLTLRKRAYGKLGIHDRMRLTRLAG